MASLLFSGFLLLAALTPAAAPSAAAAAAACKPALRSISLTPATVPGGAPTKATVTLTCATAKPLAVSLRGFTGVTVPAAVTVAKGKMTGAGIVRTATTKSARRGAIAATLGAVRKTATLTVTATPKTCKTPAMTSLTLPGHAYVGERPAAVVKLGCAAAAPVRVTLRSSNSSLPVPATVTIARYYATATLRLTPKSYEPGQYRATVTAKLGTKSLARTITVDPGITELAVYPDSGGPNNIHLEVLITGIAPAGGVTVKLASSSPAVTVPATFVVPSPAVGAEVSGVTVHAVTRNTPVTFTATLGTTTVKASYTLLPPWNNHDSLKIIADQGARPVYGLENYLNYYLVLSNPAPASGLTAAVTLGDPSALTFEIGPPVHFSAGQVEQTVEVNVSNVTSPVHTTITATVDGVTAQLPVVIEPGLASFTLPATLSTGTTGATATGTITLAGPVDTDTTVGLQSTWGILTVPPTVTVKAGQDSATFPISVVPVTSDSPVSIDAYLGTSTLQSGNIDVTP